jgi:acetoin utilization deacetylase AcuC-like enzyme
LTLLLASPRFAEHTTPPGHPEQPDRAHVFDSVAARWRELGTRVLAPRSATREELIRVHSPGYVRFIEGTRGRAVALDPDTFTSPESVDVALLAAGAAVQAAQHAKAHREAAIALVRPPGHHAEPDGAMGFCLFNNIGIAAAAMLDEGLSRVAIVDIDVHHGNGTQRMFYDDRRVLYVSTHQFPFYPGTGAATEIGAGDGAGYTVNVPLEAGATDADYDRVQDVIDVILDQYAPEMLLVSAGFDAHEDDPLASMRMTTAGYANLVTRLKRVADRHCPIALVTEGGYDLDALAACLDATLGVITGKPSAAIAKTAGASAPRADRALQDVRAALSRHWPAI